MTILRRRTPEETSAYMQGFYNGRDDENRHHFRNRDKALRELRKQLRVIAGRPNDEERDHADADKLLLAYIGDKIVTREFEAIDKWYA